MRVRHCITGLIGALLLCGFRPAGGAGAAASSAEKDSIRPPLHHYTEGIKLLCLRADTAGAREAFLTAIGLDSDYAPAYYELARMMIDRNNDDVVADAEAYARRAHELDTANHFYLGLYAQALIFNRKLRDARAAYRELTRLESRNPDNFRMLALLTQHTGHLDEALAILDSAELLFGPNSSLGYMKRQILFQSRRYDQALEQVLKVMESAPYDAENHQLLGEIYLAKGNDSLGLASLERAVELDSTQLEPLILLADYYNRHSDYANYFNVSRRIFENDELPLEEKVRIFRQFTGDMRFYREFYPQISALARTLAVRYPREKAVVELYGRHLIASGEIEQALALYKLHLEDEPPQLDYHTMVIDIESYLQRPDSAEYYLARAIERFPGRPELYLQQGHLAAVYAKDYERAVACYRQGLESAGSDSLRSVVWGYIGDVYQQQSQGECRSAEESFARRDNGRGSWKKYLKKCYDAYDRALKYDRDNISVLNNYAYFLSLEGRDLNRALEMSSRAVALTDNNPTYLDTHAWVLFKLGRLDEAKRYLQQAVSLDGQKSPELQLHYGDVLAALGENFMAEIYWKRALENGYDPAEIERRIEKLKNSK